MDSAGHPKREVANPRSRLFDLGVWGPSVLLLLILSIPLVRDESARSGHSSAATLEASAVRLFLEARWGELLAEYRAGDLEKDYERKNRAQQQLAREIETTNALGLRVVARLLTEERHPLAREFIYLAVGSHRNRAAIELFAKQLEWLEEAAATAGPSASEDSLTPTEVEYEARSIFTALGLIGSDASFELLVDRLRLGREPWPVRSLRALAVHPRGGEVTALCIDRLEDPAPGVRAAAALVLGRHPSDAAIGSLAAGLARVEDFSSRLAFITALGQSGEAAAAEPLFRVLESDPDSKLREAAVEALARIVDQDRVGAEELARRLAEHARSETAPRVRAKALEVARNVLGD